MKILKMDGKELRYELFQTIPVDTQHAGNVLVKKLWVSDFWLSEVLACPPPLKIGETII
jgi:hypothetical protein